MKKIIPILVVLVFIISGCSEKAEQQEKSQNIEVINLASKDGKQRAVIAGVFSKYNTVLAGKELLRIHFEKDNEIPPDLDSKINEGWRNFLKFNRSTWFFY